MSTAYSRRLTMGLGVTALVAALFSAGAAVPLADRTGELRLLIASAGALAALALLFAMPIRALGPFALTVTLLIPSEATVLPHVLQGSALGAVPLAVWLVRAPGARRSPGFVRLLAVALGMWLALSSALAPFHTHRGSEWLVTAAIAFVVVLSSPPQGLDREALRRLFLGIVTVLAAYAVLEGLVLHHNPLFSSLFDQTPWWKAEHDAVSYRVTGLLGHPLFNGLVFSSAAVLAASELLRGSGRPALALGRLALLVMATDVVHSRGASIALAVGVLALIATGSRREPGRGRRRLLLTICLLVAATLLLAGLHTRDESAQGQKSAQVRVATLTRAKQALSMAGPFGAGPGQSDAYRHVNDLPGSGTALENSYAELAVSLGVVGLLLVALPLLSVVAIGLRNDAVAGEAAALLTILVAMAGFNAIEGHKPTMILIALLCISILTAPRVRSAGRSTAIARSACG
ncbi:MAG TPA: O-antigen ligase family protein [Solirubrobacteraceae bacterium]|jgi:hypothetical protein